MSTLRIIAGKAKGMRIHTVPGDSTRPITDRAKESLFNIISTDLIDTEWLDCYGGTGSVSIEALSRGAKSSTILDLHPLAIETIKRNLTLTKFSQQCKVIKTDTLVFLKKIPNKSYDYVFIAPPQYKGLWRKTIELLDNNPGWIAEDGWIIVQIHPIEYQSIKFENFEEFDQRKYGSTLFVFYQRPLLE
ncbi:MAG: 16S rRNA (guanine(966)-N(2))-methyltransferase RsmD [Anaerolineaceae bacterium]|jgi:16S rRNA (guanine(966)-N(2))-methyltransferase RsmD|nr:16S rRNA (guanine(966)-N(2))-methyltransferase RsmD [Anaerolineaceae bacterium]